MQPEKIGIYEIKSELGRGGMATVYRGYDPRFEREVAVKVLPPELLHADPQFRARFEREAKIIAKLEHPSIVPVYDVGEENNQPYFVMRFMNGGSLSDRIKAGIMKVENAAKILDQIAPGLDEAHAKGFVHRDLKPSNILFDGKGIPYISDFGIAKISQGSGTMTGSGIIGTPAYMSPEQATGDPVDGRADVYALGIILFEMLTGKQPYEADTPMAVAIKHVTDPVPRILTVNPNLPADMDLIIQKAMAKDRNDRFSTAVEMVQTLKEVAGIFGPEQKNKTLTALKTSLKKKTEIAPKKRSPAIVFIVLLIVAGVGAGGYYFATGNSFGLIPEALTPTSTSAPATATTQPTIESTGTSVPATETATLVPSTATATIEVPQAPLIGGADMVAFTRDNDIWIMNVDGSELRSVTNDHVEKFNVEWLPDGGTILYITGKTVKTVNVTDLREEIVTSFASAEYFDAFRVSPDGTQVAISLNRELHIVPFKPEAFGSNPSKASLLAMDGCLFYNDIGVKDLLWSDDGQKVAVEFAAPSGNNVADTIRVLDVHLCKSSAPIRQDEFPAARFAFPLDIVNFDWDGDLLFALNTSIRNGGFGDLYFYNTFTHKAETVAPVDGKCCYRDAAFSPDGTYVIFAFQDINLGTEGPILFYYIPTGSLTTEGALEPIPLPDGFFTQRNDTPMPIFRRAQP